MASDFKIVMIIVGFFIVVPVVTVLIVYILQVPSFVAVVIGLVVASMFISATS